MRCLRSVWLLLPLCVAMPFEHAAAMQQPVTPTSIAVPASAPAASGVPAETHSLTAEDLGAFFDGIIPMQLERSDIAGASVLIMQNGKVLLKKGYGFADIKKKGPVNPASTIFRLASISEALDLDLHYATRRAG